MTGVLIAPARRADAEELIQSNLDSRAYHAPWVQPFTDREGFERWFGQLTTGPNIGMVARERASHAVIGVLHINQIVLGVFSSAYVGFYGSAAHARRGLMRQALTQTVCYAFEEVGLHRLEANIQPGNLASIALVRRAGFHKEGYSPCYLKIDGAWRDHERWAILAKDGTRKPDI